uniref:Uncharacterized protein n=1 Tax=Steinernema glaseri TaxID=37863 RepID=A0A1I8AD05_9BILA
MSAYNNNKFSTSSTCEIVREISSSKGSRRLRPLRGFAVFRYAARRTASPVRRTRNMDQFGQRHSEEFLEFLRQDPDDHENTDGDIVVMASAPDAERRVFVVRRRPEEGARPDAGGDRA